MSGPNVTLLPFGCTRDGQSQMQRRAYAAPVDLKGSRMRGEALEHAGLALLVRC